MKFLFTQRAYKYVKKYTVNFFILYYKGLFKICKITLFSFIATKPPGSLQFDKTKHKEGIPLTPTGYTQPPTPDFPPPSPHTAILGIEERMAIIDVS